ncbi:glycosyltransferase family 2 protein [Pontimonas sp.]|nr:glycosyltransferase family 2 protein [Pontimonas sp.]
MGDRACAPVVLIGYRRPEMTAQVLDAIIEAQPSHLFLVMDGPKRGDADDSSAVAAVRAVLEGVPGETPVTKIFSESNLGLKARVVSGLDEVFATVEEAIIVEDDCLPSPDFFRYATELLDRYRSTAEVGIVSGSSRLRGEQVSSASYDFSSDVRIWGWATWGRTWRSFSASGDLEGIWSETEQAALVNQFPHGARRRAMKKMLKTAGALDSWALPFVVHCLSRGYLNAVPTQNLVANIGLGSSSTHTRFESWVAYQDAVNLEFPLRHPDAVLANSRLDAVESRGDARELWAYPLRHPIDALRRVLRYVQLMANGK